MQDITIATRIFGNLDLLNGTEYEVRDRMVRKPCGSFYLIEGPGRPGEPEVEKPYSLQGVFEWLRDCPEQIERAVILGGRSAERAKRLFPPELAEVSVSVKPG